VLQACGKPNWHIKRSQRERKLRHEKAFSVKYDTENLKKGVDGNEDSDLGG